MPTTRCVAVFNSSEDLIELLRLYLENAGYVVISGHIDEIRRDKLDLDALVRQHRPSVVLYDLIPPYERNWLFVEHLRTTSPLRDIPFIITSTNAKVARELGARTDVIFEVFGRPFDLDAVVDAVRRAVAPKA
jgi:DNA-binding NtrC family response regulator